LLILIFEISPLPFGVSRLKKIFLLILEISKKIFITVIAARIFRILD